MSACPPLKHDTLHRFSAHVVEEWVARTKSEELASHIAKLKQNLQQNGLCDNTWVQKMKDCDKANVTGYGFARRWEYMGATSKNYTKKNVRSDLSSWWRALTDEEWKKAAPIVHAWLPAAVAPPNASATSGGKRRIEPIAQPLVPAPRDRELTTVLQGKLPAQSHLAELMRRAERLPEPLHVTLANQRPLERHLAFYRPEDRPRVTALLMEKQELLERLRPSAVSPYAPQDNDEIEARAKSIDDSLTAFAKAHAEEHRTHPVLTYHEASDSEGSGSGEEIVLRSESGRSGGSSDDSSSDSDSDGRFEGGSKEQLRDLLAEMIDTNDLPPDQDAMTLLYSLPEQERKALLDSLLAHSRLHGVPSSSAADVPRSPRLALTHDDGGPSSSAADVRRSPRLALTHGGPSSSADVPRSRRADDGGPSSSSSARAGGIWLGSYAAKKRHSQS